MCAWDLFAPPGVIRQLDGSQFGSDNCAAATAAAHAMSERQGRRPMKGAPWPPSGFSIRKASGDTSGGLKASQVDETLRKTYNIDPDFQIATTTLVRAKLRAGFPVIFLHSYGPISDAGFSGSPGFRGNHSALLTDDRSEPNEAGEDCDPLYDKRRAGIPEGPQWVPWTALVRAGEQLVIEKKDGQTVRMINRYGAGKLYVGFGRVPYRPDDPVSYMRYSVGFGEGSFYTYELSAGRIVSRRARQFSGPTSARCSAPAVYPWPGNTPRRLVRMLAGALKNEYVAVPQGSARLIEKEVSV